MKNLIFLPLWLIAAFSFGQSKSKRQTADSLSSAKLLVVSSFLDLTLTDSIADIGTGSGYSLIPIANKCPQCKFVVQDIDSSTCNPKSLNTRIKNSGNIVSSENFSFYYGTEITTNLPTARFNKILLFDVLHELTYKREMLNDIKRVLATNGSIYIEEILVHKPVKKDKICNYPFFTEQEFKNILVANNIFITRESITLDTGKNKYIKIFECKFLP